MLNWFTKRRLAKLKLRLEIENAKWDHEMWIARATGHYYPIALASIAERRATLNAKIRALEVDDGRG